MVRNEDYSSAPADAKHQGPAYLEKLTWRFLKDNTARFGALQSGKAQVIFNVPPESVPAATADPHIATDDFVHAGVPFSLDLNTTSPALSDLRVRRAIVHAADAPGIVSSAYAGVFPYEGNAISSGTPTYDRAFSEPYPYDAERAEALLDEAGWTDRDAEGYRTRDGERLTLRFPFNSDPGETPPADLTIYQNFQAMLKRVGVEVELHPLGRRHDDRDAQRPDRLRHPGPLLEQPEPERHVHQVLPGDPRARQRPERVAVAYDEELDETLLEAAATTDPGEQDALYSAAQRAPHRPGLAHSAVPDPDPSGHCAPTWCATYGSSRARASPSSTTPTSCEKGSEMTVQPASPVDRTPRPAAPAPARPRHPTQRRHLAPGRARSVSWPCCTAHSLQLGSALLLLWAVASIVFLLQQMVPGDPALAILGGASANPPPETVEAVRAQYGFDRAAPRAVPELPRRACASSTSVSPTR